jgi:hypothetical protein
VAELVQKCDSLPNVIASSIPKRGQRRLSAMLKGSYAVRSVRAILDSRRDAGARRGGRN